ncbi:hypothetical protein ACH5RR_013350 [Cinchona calisaya]|uniref:Dof-type domain-containing protein n=1 Tax=Cinchona calisaya TaxID=153742 RepID=A0ABD3A159_9GENT
MYWTKGGSLRGMPMGGGCRKNKKSKPPSHLNSKDTNNITSDHIGIGLNFFHGVTPSMDFQLGGLSFPRILDNNHSSSTIGLFVQLGGLNSLDPSGISDARSLKGFNNFPLFCSQTNWG